jgi:hypothetical protein
MNPTRDIMVQIAVIVLVVVAGGTGIFLYTGVPSVILGTAVLVPVAILGRLGLYRQSQSSPNDEQAEMKRQRALESAQTVRDRVLRDYYQLHDLFGWNPPALQQAVDRLQSDLRDNGVELETESRQQPGRSFPEPDVTVSEVDEQALDSVDQGATQVRRKMEDEFRRFAETRETELESYRDKLESKPLVESVGWPADSVRNASGLDEVRDRLEAQQMRLQSAISDAVNTLRDTVSTASDGPDGSSQAREDLNAELQRAESAAMDGEFDEALAALDSARRMADTVVADTVGGVRAEALSLAGAITDSPASEYAPTLVKEVENIADELRQTRVQTSEAASINDHIADLRETCIRIVRQLNQQLEDYLDDIASANRHIALERPDILDEDVVTKIETIDDVESFRDEWESAVKELVWKLDDTKSTAVAATAMDRYEGDIVDALDRHGQLSRDDLRTHVGINVDQGTAAEIMEMIADEYGAVTFDSEEMVVRLPVDEEHDLDVPVELAHRPEGRTKLTVTVDGPGFEDDDSFRTDDGGIVSFSGVPYGEYTVRATAATPTVGEAERTVQVHSDERMDPLVLSTRDPVERFCGGDEDSVRAELEKGLGDELEKIYEQSERVFDQRQLHSDLGQVRDRLPPEIDDTTINCLLAIWGTDAGLSVRVDGDRVFVFDEPEAVSVIESQLRSMDPGETVPAMDATALQGCSPEFVERLLTGTDIEQLAEFQNADLRRSES